MLQQIVAIARNAFVEALRQPIYLLLVLLCGALLILTTWSTGFTMAYATGSAEVGGDDKFLFDLGLATVFVCGMLLAAFVATAVLSREIENRTALMVVSKPVSRTAVIIGKYIGISLSLLIALAIMLVFLLMAIRHGVMTTAADRVDQPVVLFGLGAIFLSVALAAWCNFYYGWAFPQTTTVAMLPLILIAYLLVLLVDKRWGLQSIGTDFKPSVTLASACLGMALLLLTAVATAASTRLSQVMTIVICAGVFFFGLLSNHLVGRHAFQNTPVARIDATVSNHPTSDRFLNPGDSYTIQLAGPPNEAITTGRRLFYAPNPNGLGIIYGTNDPTPVDPFDDDGDGPTTGMFVSDVEDLRLILEVRGDRPQPIARPPEEGDFLFFTPTHINPIALGIWGAVPNMHYYWLLDAVGQNQRIPASHLGLIALYTAAQVSAFLALAVFLFQRRDVG